MTKSIELDDVAYARLEAARQGKESWSEVIKRSVRSKPSVATILRRYGSPRPISQPWRPLTSRSRADVASRAPEGCKEWRCLTRPS
jgi:predicted CopG family antitoxin